MRGSDKNPDAPFVGASFEPEISACDRCRKKKYFLSELYTKMRDRFPTPTTLDNRRVQAMHRQYAHQVSTSPGHSPLSRSPDPLNQVLQMVHSPKIRKFLEQHRARLSARSENLIMGLRAVNAQNIRMDDMKTMKDLNKDLKLIQKSPPGAFPDIVRDIAGLGVNILFALTSKKAESMTTLGRAREYQEWKVVWYLLVDPRNNMWKTSPGSPAINLSSMPKKDLDHMAREMEIRGRSKMSRAELTRALQSKMAM